MGEGSDDARPGFDYWASHKGQGTYNDTEFNVNGTRQVLKGYYTSRVTDLAAGWLKRGRARPFCLIVGHKAAHTPFEPEPKYEHIFDAETIRKPSTVTDFGEGKPAWIKERLKTWHGVEGPLFGQKDYETFVRNYLATLPSVDDGIGVLYEALRQIGELDNTIFIFTSDNGFLLGEHGMTDKRTMHEESIRVPLLVRHPKLVAKGTVVREMVLNIDLAPSVLEVCGAEPLEGIHGRSFLPLLRGEKEGWRTSWYYEYNYEKQFPYTPNVRGVRTREWKYVHYPSGDGGPDRHRAELYSLLEDPRETRNLIDDPAYARKVTELNAELERLKAEAGGIPDAMPIDEGVKKELPEKSIR
jgi:N-acetylglucosamine-6-sulfatase